VTGPVILARAAWTIAVSIIRKAVENALSEKVLDHIRLLDPIQLVGNVRCSPSRPRPPVTPSLSHGACIA